MSQPLPWTPLTNDQLSQDHRVMVTITIPFMKAMAVKMMDSSAYVLLEAQERAIRFGDDDVAAMLAGLGTACMNDPEVFRQYVEAMDAVSGRASEAMKSRVEEELKEAGLENLSIEQLGEMVRKSGKVDF